MPSFLRRLTLLALLPIAAVLTVALMVGGGLRTAHAGAPVGADCVDFSEVLLCISLDPEEDTNTVGDDHTVTATVTIDDLPLDGITVAVFVVDGPNADAANSIIGDTDASGQVSLTYTGDGGPGTDTIGAVACFEFDRVDPTIILGIEPIEPVDTCDESLASLVANCLANPAACISELGPGGGCADAPFLCDLATKDWVEPTPTPTPTPTPPPTATPTPTPTVLAAVQTPTPPPAPVVLAAAALPATGGEPSDGGTGALPWLAAIAGAIAVMSAGGVWAYGRRRVR